MDRIDRLAIDTLRTLSVEEIEAANSGHPGIALGAAPILYTLYAKVLKVNPKDPEWFNRDRFIMGAGHGSSLLYATLHLAGFGVTIDDLKNFRKLDSRTPGHPEIHITSGVDCSSGPLGQGIPAAVGMAIAESQLAERYNRGGIDLVNHYTYVLVGDGDLQEGVTQEALSLGGHLGLNKLIILFDSNDIQLDGRVDECNTENMKQKIEAMGYDYQIVRYTENIDEIVSAINRAKESEKPSFIELKTTIGKGSSAEGTNKVHGSPLSADDVAHFRELIGGNKFDVSNEVYNRFIERNEQNARTYEIEMNNRFNYQMKFSGQYEEYEDQIMGGKTVDIRYDLPHYDSNYKKATRVSSGEILTKLSEADMRFIGGSADLFSSTKAKGVDGDFTKFNRLGRNIRFGVREHAMASICNGIALHGGFLPFCSGFFVFSDYLKPAVRLSALMNLQVLYLFSHDSIAVGEDGPTHQPIEQITMLRSIPNVNVIRPADAVEVKEAYEVFLKYQNRPTVIVLTRQDVETVRIDDGDNMVMHGAYVIKEERGDLDLIIMATGSEVSLALKVSEALLDAGINARVVSMPSLNLFDEQSEAYIESVLPRGVKRVAIEADDATHMYKYLGLDDLLINIDTFGISGKASLVMDYFGFNVDEVTKKIEKFMKK